MCLALLAGMALILAIAAIYLPPPINDFLNPHTTSGGLTMLCLFGLAIVDLIALIYFVFCFSMSKYSQSLEKRLATGY